MPSTTPEVEEEGDITTPDDLLKAAADAAARASRAAATTASGEDAPPTPDDACVLFIGTKERPPVPPAKFLGAGVVVAPLLTMPLYPPDPAAGVGAGGSQTNPAAGVGSSHAFGDSSDKKGSSSSDVTLIIGGKDFNNAADGNKHAFWLILTTTALHLIVKSC